MPRHAKESRAMLRVGSAAVLALFVVAVAVFAAGALRDTTQPPQVTPTVVAPVAATPPASAPVYPGSAAAPASQPPTAAVPVPVKTPPKASPVQTPRKAATVVRPTATPHAVQPPVYSTTTVGEATAWCSGGYLHADGTCSSTPDWPTFPQPPVDNPCAGTASQCLDALSGQQNDIATMLGSGSSTRP